MYYPFSPFPFYWYWGCPQCIMDQYYQMSNIPTTCGYCSSCNICTESNENQHQQPEEISVTSDDVEEEPMWELTPEAIEMFAKSELRRQENKRSKQQQSKQKRKKQKQQRNQRAYVDLDNPQDNQNAAVE